MKLIVGLGNPGAEFENTRHNAGFVVLEAFREKCFPNEIWKKNEKFNAEIIVVKESPLKKDSPSVRTLLRPLTFMNSSGDAIAKVSSFYKINPDDILVVHDDLDILLGEYKIQKGKGAAGHHGVDSVIEKLGTKDFWRLRIGIDSPLRKKFADDAKFVLENFTKDEKKILENAFDKALEVIESWLGK